MTPKSTSTIRGQFHDKFGTTDKPFSEFGEYHDQEEQLSIGEDSVVMFVPDDLELPLGIPVAEFDPVEEVRPGSADVSDNDDISGDQTGVVALSDGTGTEHVVRIEYVARLAQVADTTVSDMCERARIHTDYAHYPPMFPLERGRVLISPYVGEWEPFTVADDSSESSTSGEWQAYE